ncbi:MAG: cell division protein SepF [Actinobacteria bacterium]|nr:cell division protein SepF [Actinomycetota bacterium]NCG37213.1 cell division protein SepF [Actinomycetota bacterium]
MSMLKKTLIYLGLGPDEEYEHYDEFAPAGAGPAQAERPGETAPGGRPAIHAVPERPSPPQSNTVRAIPRQRSTSVRVIQPNPSSPSVAAEVEPAPEADSVRIQSSSAAVRIIDDDTGKPHALSPTSFNDAQSIGDRFKNGQAVIVNLQGVDRDLRRRLVDFASGLCFALDGKMDKVATQVYLLTPADVVVSASDARRALN